MGCAANTSELQVVSGRVAGRLARPLAAAAAPFPTIEDGLQAARSLRQPVLWAEPRRGRPRRRRHGRCIIDSGSVSGRDAMACTVGASGSYEGMAFGASARMRGEFRSSRRVGAELLWSTAASQRQHRLRRRAVLSLWSKPRFSATVSPTLSGGSAANSASVSLLYGRHSGRFGSNVEVFVAGGTARRFVLTSATNL